MITSLPAVPKRAANEETTPKGMRADVKDSGHTFPLQFIKGLQSHKPS